MNRRTETGIVSGIVLALAVVTFFAVVGALVLTVRNIRREAEGQAAVRARAEEINRELVLEIRAQARLNACLSLKLAKRHGVDVSGLDSPECKVFPNGAVIFPGEEPGSLIDPTGPVAPGVKLPKPGQSPASEPGTPPNEPPPSPGGPEEPGPPPGKGPSPTPEPTVTCIPVPGPIPDFCLPNP